MHRILRAVLWAIAHAPATLLYFLPLLAMHYAWVSGSYEYDDGGWGTFLFLGNYLLTGIPEWLFGSVSLTGVAVACAYIDIAWNIFYWRWRVRRRLRAREAAGLCLSCGYDLNGLPNDVCCPECGN